MAIPLSDFYPHVTILLSRIQAARGGARRKKTCTQQKANTPVADFPGHGSSRHRVGALSRKIRLTAILSFAFKVPMLGCSQTNEAGRSSGDSPGPG